MGNQNVQHRLLWYTSGLDVLELPAHVETSSDADECPLGDWLLLTLSQCNGRGQTLESDRQNGRRTWVTSDWVCSWPAQRTSFVSSVSDFRVSVSWTMPFRPSRRRDCHFDDTPCLSLLKHIIKGQGGAIK